MLDNVIGWVKKLTEAGVSIIALAVVVQIIFGSQAAFLPGDVIARLNRYYYGTWFCKLGRLNCCWFVV